MGANFQTLSLNGSKTNKEVEQAFRQAQDQDRYENGHSYSGGFGMASGLKFASVTFPDSESALRWLEDNAEKWKEAIAVRHGSPEKTGDTWLIGAWCAS